MSIIHLIVNDKDYYVPKDVLENVDLFSGMLQFQENDLIISDINPLIFEIFITELTKSINIKKELEQLCDQLGTNVRLDLINDSYCGNRICSRMAFDKRFCLLHKCQVDNCTEYKKNKKYCHKHNCTYTGCENEKLSGKGGLHKYCNEHECIANNCDQLKINTKYCSSHNCKYANCENERLGKLSYIYSTVECCNEHKCFIEGCNRMKENQMFCSYHKCEHENCNNRAVIKPLNCGFCEEHKCQVTYCTRGKEKEDYCIYCAQYNKKYTCTVTMFDLFKN